MELQFRLDRPMLIPCLRRSQTFLNLLQGQEIDDGFGLVA